MQKEGVSVKLVVEYKEEDVFMKAKQTAYVDQFVKSGILDPEQEMKYRVKDGGFIVANTSPGCWGPMITPELKGGHEVTQPVYVEGAEVGDAIAIRIKNIQVNSIVTASGSDQPVEGRFGGDPFVDATCPECGMLNPKSVIKGIGQEAIRCENCGADITPFHITHGYSMAFNDQRNIGLTLNKEMAEKVAKDGKYYMNTPEASVQNPILTFAAHDMPGTIARLRPFLGQLGTTPARAFPDSHNAGDFAQFLIDAPHDYKMTEEEIEDRTDGHLDVNRVRTGAILIAPVKVEGGGVYLGDMHAMQGDGEIAGHTADVAGIANLQVHVLKDLTLEGPILLPVLEDLPHLAKPFTEKEEQLARSLADEWGMEDIEKTYPISFIGSGATLNDATTNGLERAARLFDVSVPEIMNRATVNGSIEIGRNPGVVTVTFLAPESYLKEKGLLDLIKDHYQLS